MKLDVGLKDFLLISPMIVLFLTSLIPITVKVLKGNQEQNPLSVLTQGLIGVLSATVLLIIFSGGGRTAFNDALIFDGITSWMGIITMMAVSVAMFYMYENPATNGDQFSELIFLTMSSALGMLILVSSTDLLMIFIGLETMSLSLYLMIGMSHEQKLAKEAAIKYFILGSLASAIFLLGVSYIFGTSSGETNLIKLVENASSMVAQNRLFLFGICFVIIGFAFKVSMAPFHAWTADVYQGAPTPHTALMSTAVKTVSFAAFLRVISIKPLFGSENLMDVLQWLAVLTMLIGNLGAIVQNNFKRMLAFSSIAHSGYLMVGIITVGVGESAALGTSSVIFYLLTYTLMTLGAFAVVSMFENTENTVVNVDDLSGLAKKKPLLALCLTVLLLSMAGIPPMLGFFSKFYLFNAAIGEGLLWLALWGVINSVISAYYYLRPIVVMYMKEGAREVAPHSLTATSAATVIFAVVVVLLGVISGPIFTAMEKSLN